MPEQPVTDYITYQAPRLGVVPVHVKADYLNLAIVPSTSLKVATAQLTGPQADKVSAHMESDGWHVDWPEMPSSVFTANGVTVVRGGRGTVTIDGGSVYVGGRSMQFNGFSGDSYGTINVRAGRNMTVTVDGDVVVAGGGTAEPRQMILHVPADSQVFTAIENGEITADGSTEAGLAMLAHHGHNANITAACPLGQLMSSGHNGNLSIQGPCGDARVMTHNGYTEIAQALGQTSVQSHNGQIDVHCMASVMVQASTHNGNVNVTAEPGARPMVQASSYNGRVRKP